MSFFRTKMGNANSLWHQTYADIKTKHDLAYKVIEEAIRLEEQEKPMEAIEKYKQGIQIIDDTLNIQVACPEHVDANWQNAIEMIQKIKRTRAEVLLRIKAIQESPSFVDSPPTYEEATSSDEGDTPKTYKDLAQALNELSFDPNDKIDEQIIYTHENVRLYFIAPSGEVTSTMEPQTLKIFSVKVENSQNAPKAMLQVGTWVYPLVPGVSPCYRTNYGAFILPNVYTDVPGSSIGIILPPEADAEVLDLLENILHGIISEEKAEEIRKQKEGIEEDMSTRISTKIVDGAWYVSQGLIRGAEKCSDFLNSSTPKIVNSIKAADVPTTIPRPVTKTMQIAECATNKAARVTGFVADKVGTATMKLGKFLAPHIQKQGTRLLSTGFKMPEQEASERVKGVLTVAAGAVEGFSTVYRGLETSATILGSNLKNNTVKVVQHKYGNNAGAFANDTFTTAGNVYNIAQNTKVLNPKGLAKRAAKDAGKAVVADYSQSMKRAEQMNWQMQSHSLEKQLKMDLPSTSSATAVIPKSTSASSVKSDDTYDMVSDGDEIDDVKDIKKDLK